MVDIGAHVEVTYSLDFYDVLSKYALGCFKRFLGCNKKKLSDMQIISPVIQQLVINLELVNRFRISAGINNYFRYPLYGLPNIIWPFLIIGWAIFPEL